LWEKIKHPLILIPLFLLAWFGFAFGIAKLVPYLVTFVKQRGIFAALVAVLTGVFSYNIKKERKLNIDSWLELNAYKPIIIRRPKFYEKPLSFTVQYYIEIIDATDIKKCGWLNTGHNELNLDEYSVKWVSCNEK